MSGKLRAITTPRTNWLDRFFSGVGYGPDVCWQHQVSGMPASGVAPGGADDRGLARPLLAPCIFQPQSAVSYTAILPKLNTSIQLSSTLIPARRTMFMAVC